MCTLEIDLADASRFFVCPSVFAAALALSDQSKN